LLQLINFCLMSKTSVELLLEEIDLLTALPELDTLLHQRRSI
jgi:hypothetical protein